MYIISYGQPSDLNDEGYVNFLKKEFSSHLVAAVFNDKIITRNIPSIIRPYGHDKRMKRCVDSERRV